MKCPNCHCHFNVSEITYQDWVSKYCPLCFREASPNDCILEED